MGALSIHHKSTLLFPKTNNKSFWGKGYGAAETRSRKKKKKVHLLSYLVEKYQHYRNTMEHYLLQTRATTEVYLFFAIFFLNALGSLTQNRRKQFDFLQSFLILYLGHGIFHPGSKRFRFLLRN